MSRLILIPLGIFVRHWWTWGVDSSAVGKCAPPSLMKTSLRPTNWRQTLARESDGETHLSQQVQYTSNIPRTNTLSDVGVDLQLGPAGCQSATAACATGGNTAYVEAFRRKYQHLTNIYRQLFWTSKPVRCPETTELQCFSLLCPPVVGGGRPTNNGRFDRYPNQATRQRRLFSAAPPNLPYMARETGRAAVDVSTMGSGCTAQSCGLPICHGCQRHRQ